MEDDKTFLVISREIEEARKQGRDKFYLPYAAIVKWGNPSSPFVKKMLSVHCSLIKEEVDDGLTLVLKPWVDPGIVPLDSGQEVDQAERDNFEHYMTVTGCLATIAKEFGCMLPSNDEEAAELLRRFYDFRNDSLNIKATLESLESKQFNSDKFKFLKNYALNRAMSDCECGIDGQKAANEAIKCWDVIVDSCTSEDS